MWAKTEEKRFLKLYTQYSSVDSFTLYKVKECKNFKGIILEDSFNEIRQCKSYKILLLLDKNDNPMKHLKILTVNDSSLLKLPVKYSWASIFKILLFKNTGNKKYA